MCEIIAVHFNIPQKEVVITDCQPGMTHHRTTVFGEEFLEANPNFLANLVTIADLALNIRDGKPMPEPEPEHKSRAELRAEHKAEVEHKAEHETRGRNHGSAHR